MRKLIFLLLLTSQAFASTTTLKQVDNIQNSTGGSSIAIPSTGTTMVTDTNTVTMTNKTISGASNTFSSIPGSAISSGTVGVANGGTGASTLTANSVITGNGTSAVGFVAPGTSGNVLTSNGTSWASTAPTAPASTINGTQAAPQSVTAAAGIALSTPTFNNIAFVKSNAGSVTVTATPSITACTSAGQALVVLGEDATNIITLQDNAGLAGSSVFLNGNWTSGLNKSLSLVCDGAAHWVEVARNN